MEMVRNALNWFEIPVSDFDRAKKFYAKIFDFDMPENQMGPNRMGFLLYELNEGGIGGAIVQGPGYMPTGEGTLVYLNGGKDLRVVLQRVEPAGGKILQEKTLVAPDLGYFAIFRDTEGNRVALHSMA
jgi:predicted enzyme related to lactoylglutathione lyase